jgi:hypothetical protein
MATLVLSVVTTSYGMVVRPSAISNYLWVYELGIAVNFQSQRGPAPEALNIIPIDSCSRAKHPDKGAAGGIMQDVTTIVVAQIAPGLHGAVED